MDLQLEDKVVCITGASGGIGRALCESFAAEGARMALFGHARFDALEEWLARQPWRERARAFRADVTRRADVERAFASARESFTRLDVCIANAGYWPSEFSLLHASSEERIQKTIGANLMGSIWTARAFMAALAQDGPRSDGHGASLMFIGSTAGRFGEKGHAEYAVAKAGLYGLVRTLKNEIVDLDPYARVNMIEPGWTVTHMARPALEVPGAIARVVRTMPLRQLARAKDIAASAIYLASPALSRHVSGQVLTVAGGMEGRSLWEAADVDEGRIRARLEQP